MKKNQPSMTTGGPGKTETICETLKAPRSVKDKTGWEIRPENRMILNGNLSPADPGNLLIPCGFEQPRKGKK